MKTVRLLCALALVIAAKAVVAQDLPAGIDLLAAPEGKAAAVQLPRLAQPLALDGDLKEWASAACVPVRYKSYITVISPKHTWRGPADAGMEMYGAWNADGLCLAAVVADDDLINTRSDGSLWQQDAIELFLDGRVGKEFMTQPCSKGAYQLFVRPPLSRWRPAQLAINARDGKIEGLKIAGKKTRTGYVVEMVIPWKAFPQLSPKAGAELGMQFALAEYDRSDGQKMQPLQMSCLGARDLWSSPDRFIRWVLVDQFQGGADVALGPQVALDVPGVVKDVTSVPIAVELGRALSTKAGKIRVRVSSPDGKDILDQTLTGSPLPAPWSESIRAQVNLPVAAQAGNYYTVSATISDSSGQVLGKAERPILLIGKIMDDVLARLAEKNIARIAQQEPFRAAAYLGAGSCFERVKRDVENGNVTTTLSDARELYARLQVLEGGGLKLSQPGLLDLLALTTDPEAQVIVEYPSAKVATVSFHCGGVPLAYASVRKYATREDAQKALQSDPESILADLSEPVIIAGLPGRIWMKSYDFTPLQLSEFAPDKQVLLISNRNKTILAADLELLPKALVQAVCITRDCPKPVKDKVEGWAKQANVPLLDLAQAMKQKRILVAGKLTDRATLKKTARYQPGRLAVHDGMTQLMVVWGDRVIRTDVASEKVAWRIVGMVSACKPVALADVDAIREDLVKQLAPKDTQPAARTDIFAGDVHMHTFYSDGILSPAGLALQSLYANMDFAVVSDHNTLDGARIAKSLVGRYGFAYPLMVGEELTIAWTHTNAYPLTELIPWKVSVPKKIKAAHAQGAIIQWNHPSPDPGWADEYYYKGIAGTGIDAWEHIPAAYAEWKRKGVLPTLIGSSDTHDGTFGDADRSLVLAPSPDEKAVVNAIKSGRVVLAAPYGRELLYGHDEDLAIVWAALAEGKALKAQRAAQLRKLLRDADLVGMLKASVPKPELKPEPEQKPWWRLFW